MPILKVSSGKKAKAHFEELSEKFLHRKVPNFDNFKGATIIRCYKLQKVKFTKVRIKQVRLILICIKLEDGQKN